MRSNILTTIVLAVSLLLAVASVWYTNHLSARFAQVEQDRMALWAEATRLLVMADDKTDISFYSSIIAANTTIPVYMTDSAYHVIMTRNVKAPKGKEEEYYARRINKLLSEQEPITVQISPSVRQYIFYEESNILRQLRLFPILQLVVLLLFMVVLVVYVIVSYRSEQDRVWVGLTRETAHQLGTPISALSGWYELLKDRYPEDELLPQMQDDLSRLQRVSERFSKIGSQPNFQEVDFRQVVERVYAYMRVRISEKVVISLAVNPISNQQGEAMLVLADPLLLEWVIENLMKNAVDAMNGVGELNLNLQADGKTIRLDVTDSGKGMDRRTRQRIFRPGFTTKQRGWGLGLSLSKRIVEEYHHGKLFVHHSAPGEGTSIKMILNRKS